ncbi:MAG: TolC family outer membrane protein [Alphaproteobacteria bacterium]
MSERSRGRFGRVLALLLAASALTGPAAADTLVEAWIRAYQANPTLDAQRAALRAADERVNQALSGWRPIVQGSGSAGYVGVNSSFPAGTSSTNLYPARLVLSLQQPIYRGGRTVAGTDRAESDVEVQRAILMDVEQQVFLDVGTAYMNVLRDQAVVELSENNVRVLDRQLEATQDRFSVGEVTRTDVALAEAAAARARADLTRARGFLEVSRASYERLVGNLPGRLEPPPAILDMPQQKAEALDAAQNDNPTVLASLFAERSARAAVRLVEGELLPTVSLNASVSRDWNSQVRDGRIDQARITGDVVVPLYQGGGVSARIREAKQLEGQQRIRTEEARRRAVEAATQAWESLESARARIQSLGAQIEASEIALEGTQQEALVGTRTVLDVLDAEQALLDARVNLVTSERDLAVAAFQLAAASGRLTAERLRLPIAYYDPNQYHEAARNRWWGSDPSPSSPMR